MVALGERRWTLARCPVHGHVLGEVAGDDATLRKKCTECRRFWVFESATGRYLMESADATALTILSPPLARALTPA